MVRRSLPRVCAISGAGGVCAVPGVRGWPPGTAHARSAPGASPRQGSRSCGCPSPQSRLPVVSRRQAHGWGAAVAALPFGIKGFKQTLLDRWLVLAGGGGVLGGLCGRLRVAVEDDVGDLRGGA